MSDNRHPGINMHKLPVGGGFIGLLFAIGCSLIFVLGFPALWYFVALAFALGIGVAIVLKMIGNRRSDRNRPLSILHANAVSKVPARTDPDRRRSRFHASPASCSI